MPGGDSRRKRPIQYWLMNPWAGTACYFLRVIRPKDPANVTCAPARFVSVVGSCCPDASVQILGRWDPQCRRGDPCSTALTIAGS